MLCSGYRVPLSCNLRQVLEHDVLIHVLHLEGSWSFDMIGRLAGCTRDRGLNLNCTLNQLLPIFLFVRAYPSNEPSFDRSLSTFCVPVKGDHPRSGSVSTYRSSLLTTDVAVS